MFTFLATGGHLKTKEEHEQHVHITLKNYKDKRLYLTKTKKIFVKKISSLAQKKFTHIIPLPKHT